MTVEEILELLKYYYKANKDLEKEYLEAKDENLANYARGAHLTLAAIIKEVEGK